MIKKTSNKSSDRYMDSSVYDKAILSKTDQQQIDAYYYPVKKPDKYRIELILKYLKPGVNDKILDAGCGVGTFAFHSAKAGSMAYGVDYSHESIRLAKKLCLNFGVDKKTSFVTAEITELPFEDKFFDKIIAADIIEHISDKQKDAMLKEMKRVLKDNGYIVVFTPNAVRDRIGLFYKKVTGQKISKWDVDAHFGLISRRKYEVILRRNGMEFEFIYQDLTHPFIAKIPVIRSVMVLNLLWIIRKKK